MSKLVLNETTGALIDITGSVMIGMQGATLASGTKGFAIVCYHSQLTMGGAGFKIAEFSNEEDAKMCLAKITTHRLSNEEPEANHVIIVVNVIRASIIEIASAKDTSSLLQK